MKTGLTARSWERSALGLALALALVLCLAPPARADKRLDDAVAKAEAQLAKGKPDEAVKILQKAASQAKRDPLPQLALAGLLARLGRMDEAGIALSKAGELAASAPAAVQARVFSERSTLVLRTGEVQEAEAIARQAVAASAGAQSLAALARAQARAGDPAARETADRAVSAGAMSVAAHIARGDARRAAWLGLEAEAAYRRALELDPRSHAALTGLALSLALQGRAGPALEAARAAAAADPGSAEAQVALGMAALARDPLDPKSEAMVAFQQAAIAEPKSALAKLAVARAFEGRDQLPQAAAAYLEAAGLDATWGLPRIGSLRVQLKQGDPTGALLALRALPDELKLSGEADLLLGQLLSQGNDPVGARAALDRAVAALPGNAEAQAAHGKAAYDAGELALAADALERAATLAPGNLDYALARARYLAYDGRSGPATAAIEAVKAHPESQTKAVMIELGAVYRGFRPPRVEEAVAAYKRALELDPKSGEAALGIAQSYRAGRQWVRAAEAYERVPAVNRRLEGEAMVGAAWCHLRSGDGYRARFYTGLAVRAGGDVDELRAALSSGSAAGSDELADLDDQLRAKHAGVQARAVRGLIALGRPAVPTLAAALGRKSTSLAAREAIVAGLAGMGPAARDALPQLDRLIKAGPPSAASTASPGVPEREAKLVAAMEAAAAKIRGN